MSHTLYTAASSSQNPLAKGILATIADTDELLSQLMFQSRQGESFTYTREKALPTVEFVAPDHTSLGESSGTTERVTVPMRIIASNVDVMDFADQQMSEFNQQRAAQLRMKLKAMGRTIGQKLITGSYAGTVTVSAAIAGITAYAAGPNQDSLRHGPGSIRFTVSGDLFEYRAPGDTDYGAPVAVSTNGAFVLRSSNPSRTMTITRTTTLPVAAQEVLVRIATSTEEWDGLLRLTEGRQLAATGANGDQLTLELMDKMIDQWVKVRERRVFIMPPQLKGKFYSLVRAIPGAREEVTTLPGVNGQVPSYRGIPIIQSDWIPTTDVKGSSGATLTSLFLVSLDPVLGFWMGSSAAGGAQDVDLDPQKVRVMGIQVKDIGALENKDAHRTRLTFYGAPALGSELAVVRAIHLIHA